MSVNSGVIVTELLIYPVKSCAGIQVQEAKTTQYGLSSMSNPLLSDRRWMIVKNGRQLTQRQESKMTLIKPSFVDDGLVLRAPGMSELKIPINPVPTEIVECECWEVPIKGRKYGENVSKWISTFLETPDLDLVYFDNEFQGRVCKEIEIEQPIEALDTDVVSYHDLSPFHLCSIESVDDLNKRLSKKD